LVLVVIGPFCDDIKECPGLLCPFVGPAPAIVANDMNIIVGVYVEYVAVCADKRSGHTALGSIGVVGRINIVLLNIFIVIRMITINRIACCNDYCTNGRRYFRIDTLATPCRVPAPIRWVASAIEIIECFYIIVGAQRKPWAVIVISLDCTDPNLLCRYPTRTDIMGIVGIILSRAPHLNIIHEDNAGLIATINSNMAARGGGTAIGIGCGFCPGPQCVRPAIKYRISYVPSLVAIASADDVDVVGGINGGVNPGDVAAAEDGCSGVGITKPIFNPYFNSVDLRKV